MSRCFSLLLVLLLGFSTVYSQLNSLEYASDIYRVSPYGTCDSTLLRPTAPCFTSNKFGFTVGNSTTNTLAGKSIRSLIAAQISGSNFIYLGLNNGQIVVVQYASSKFSILQTVTTPSGTDFRTAVSDTARTYVAFISYSTTATVLLKYPIGSDGRLGNASSLDLGTVGLNTVQAYVFSDPNVWIGAGSKVAQVDLSALNVVASLDISTVITAVSTSNVVMCGAPNSDFSTILFSTNNGVIFSYATASNSLTSSTDYVTVTDTFSRACAAKSSIYAVFQSTTGNLYQFNFPPAFSSTPTMVLSNVGLNRNVELAVVNSDQSGFYLPTYTAGQPTSQNEPDTVYEFALYPNTVDFSAVIQPTSPDEDSRYYNVYAAGLIPSSTTMYIATSAVNPTLYQFTTSNGLVSSSINSNTSSGYHLYADYSLPTNPVGDPARTGSIADVGQTAGNGNLLIGCGVANLNAYISTNSSLAIPPRGPTTTYLRGTKSVSPNNGGGSNLEGPISLRLLSLDEVSNPVKSSNGTVTVTLKRSMPFFNSNEAPWWNSGDIKPDGTTQTGFDWIIGRTDSIEIAAHQFSYLVPPFPQVVNNTVTPPQSSKSSSKRTANQFSPGYVSFELQEECFLQNFTMVPLNNITYNITTRTFRYQFSITSWQFSSNTNFLRLNIIVGVGPDGNGTLSVTRPSDYSNSNNTNITNPFSDRLNSDPVLQSWIISAESADWEIVLPQNMNQTNTFVDAPAPCEFNAAEQVISVYFPYSNNATTGKSVTQTYTLFLEYAYIPPPLPEPSIQDGGGPHLLPLWIVIGVVGGLLIIGIIVAIIVVIIVYKVIWRKTQEYELETTFEQTEGALRAAK